jgi:outer membrane scaffolding protein for murein synthesis (MipA/OmpV family)
MWVLACAAAHAADEPAATPEVAPTAQSDAPKQPEWKWEGAIGPVVNVSPQYGGASSRKISVDAGFYLRYGRISISNASGFVTRRNKDDVFRGLGLDLKRDDRLRLNVALRIDRGRRSADVPGLAGIENVRSTIRARTSATWQFDHGWKASAGWSADLLGRGGGNVFDLGVSHDRRLSPLTTWGIGLGMGASDRRHMQSYYGVTESESQATGHPVYFPGAGVREVSLGTSWRTEINDQWVLLWGGSIGRLVGPAAQSPLTVSPRTWGLNAALGWRF